MQTSTIPPGNLKYLIRKAECSDAAPVAALLGELGYPTTSELAQEKIKSLSGSNDAIFVVDLSGTVAGFISIHLLPMIHVPGLLGKVTGLVVTEKYRGMGFGKALIMAAESFAKVNGATRIEIISGHHRPQAHGFYKSVGYSVPDQTRFIREVG